MKFNRKRLTMGEITTGGKQYPSSGTGFDMPPGATIVGYTRSTEMAQRAFGKPLMVPRWVAPVQEGGQSAGAAAPTINVTVPTTVNVPTTTNVTSQVSPVTNIAAGNEGTGNIGQGGGTSQQATPVTRNEASPTSTVGMDSTQVAQLLEQQRREQDALYSQREQLAIQKAELTAQKAAYMDNQRAQADYDARLLAVKSAAQVQPLTQTQSAPVAKPVEPPKAVTVEPVKNPLQIATLPVKPWYILAAVFAGGVFLATMDDKNGNKRKRKQSNTKR